MMQLVINNHSLLFIYIKYFLFRFTFSTYLLTILKVKNYSKLFKKTANSLWRMPNLTANDSVEQQQPTEDIPRVILRTARFCRENPDIEKRSSAMIEEVQIYEKLLNDLGEKSVVIADKSLFVRDIIKEKKHNRIVFTLPRRWGKTINLTMLDFFLKRGENDVKFEERFGQWRESLELFRKENLPFCQQHCGKYPTIFVSFMELKGADSFEKFLKAFGEIMSKCFQAYDFVYRGIDKQKERCINDNPSRAARLDVAKDQWMKIVREEADQSLLERSLKILSELIYFHFEAEENTKIKANVIILLDELDAMVNSIYTSKRIKNDDIDEMITFFRQFSTRTFKEHANPYYKKVIATGVYNTFKFFDSPMNDFQIYTMLENPFAKYFGFTEDDMKHIADQCGFSEEEITKCKFWYNRYHAHDSLDNKTYLMHNPASIARFVKNRTFESNMMESRSVNVYDQIFKDEKIREKILQTLAAAGTPAELNLAFERKDMDAFKRAENNVELQPIDSDDEEFVHRFLSFLYASGFLDAFHENGELLVRVPNMEHQIVIEKKLREYYKLLFKKYNQFIEPVSKQLEHLYTNKDITAEWKLNSDKLKEAMDILMKELPKPVSTATKQQFQRFDGANPIIYGTEDIFHSLFNHIALLINNVHIFGSEIFAKTGTRSDTIFADYKRNIGVIVEHKYEDKLKNKSNNVKDKDALIQAVGYKSILEDHKLDRIVFLGIVYKDEQTVDIDLFVWKIDDVDSTKKFEEYWQLYKDN